MRLTLEDNYFKNTIGPRETWTPVSRSVSWDSKTTQLENDIPMIFEYLKQYQDRLKIRLRCDFGSAKMIPQAKVDHIDKLLEKYKSLYTKAWEWDDRL